jgi:hypothetical protein
MGTAIIVPCVTHLYALFNRELNVQECDARMLNKSAIAGFIQ